ncbi:MAG: PQQ-dependent sugar dehydrogenase [Bacteroidia bacterium]|nr:PQQ-dependent sugar dehydrogenase [Bacteroidia bacterium]
MRSLLFLFLLLVPALGSGQTANKLNLKLAQVASGFTSPVGMACPDDGTFRIFVFEQGGKIYIIENGQVLKEPFLNISNRLDGLNIAYSEKGLLGMAFHPDYKNNGQFYLYYSSPDNTKGNDHKSTIAVYKVNPANPDKAIDEPQVIMEIAQPESNHNGGMLAFGPDGYLYIGTGDGGGANDEHGTIGNGQNLNTLLGKILRIDVDKGTPYKIPEDNPFVGKPDTKPEIWAYGLRNPWRFSFDKVTGKLFCGDVGQNKYEEINIIKKGGNYGWRIMEGYHCFNPKTNCDKTGLLLPIDEYDHDTGISICGGHMYRGKMFPSLHGNYFFGDWSGKVFALKQLADGSWQRSEVIVNENGSNETDGKINSFGEDINGEVYILTQKLFGPKSPTGVLYRIGY